LATIPFEALPTKKIAGEEFKNVSYLINRVGISYDFSASLFLQKSKLPASNAAPSIFLCAPVTFDAHQNLNALPGTEKEVMDIANLFAGKSKEVKFADANESLIKSKELGSYNYLHFATHGVVDEENPASSRIFLSSNTTDDGNLYAGEIYNLNLNANLAVLSACQTGLGKVSKGEGVIGLSRALIYAGAKNIIVSFWTVADESTAELMTNFYRELATNPNQDFKKALQKAKLKMIREGKFANPYYWAPFVLIGD
jgi:CHAT domain-containing protein